MRASAFIANRFELHEVAGVGGMATVYRATDHATGGTVAFKRLNGSSFSDVTRFEREARVLRDLDHPNIVNYVDCGLCDNGDPYLVMEWIAGETLDHMLKRGPLVLSDTLTIARAICKALTFIHGQQLVHRDIKPSNLMLIAGDPHRVKVLDFGVARSLTPSRRQVTSTGVIIGTAGYLAPEQARGLRDLTPAVDVYALGCVLFHCVTGHGPFEADHDIAVFVKILMDEIPRATSLRPDLSPELDDLIYRMMARDPDARPADGAEAASSLQIVINGTASDTLPPAHVPKSLDTGRVVSVILVALETLAAGPAATTLSDDEITGLIEPLKMVAQRYKAQLERLPHGAVVVLLSGKRSDASHASDAVRCAFTLQSFARHCGVSVITRDAACTRSPIEDAVEQAILAVNQVQGRSVITDGVTASQLGTSFELVAEGPWHLVTQPRYQGEPPTLLGRPAPLFGRDRELTTLGAAYYLCVSTSQAQAMLVSGPAGIGKSRLTAEFLLRWPDPEALILHGRGAIRNAGEPHGLLADAIRRAWLIGNSDPLDAQRQSIVDHVAARLSAPHVDRVARHLGRLVGVPFPAGENTVRLDQEAPQLRQAWLEWLAAESACRPVMIVLEDLQWGDAPSVRLVDAALSLLRNAPLFVVAVSRPAWEHRFPGLWADHHVRQIALDPLDLACQREQVTFYLPQLPDGKLVAIIEEGEGNPLRIEELLLAAADDDLDALGLTTAELVARRIRRLPAAARRTLRAASVFGTTFWPEGVQALIADEIVTDHTLEMLISCDVICESATSRFRPSKEFRFRHPMIGNVVYRSIGQADKVIGHCLAAKWLEEMGESNALSMAEHCVRGAVMSKAAMWYHRTAEAARLAEDWPAVHRLANRAITCGARDAILQRCEILKTRAKQEMADHES